MLRVNGHEVVGMTRSAAKFGTLRKLGAEPVAADGLDREAVIDAVTRSEPEVVVHQMTGLSGMRSLRNFDNIADDEPAPVAEWLPELARVLGAEPPRRVPAWLGLLAGGEVGVSMMTRIRGASNAKAKRELGWQLLYPTWREGFRCVSS